MGWEAGATQRHRRRRLAIGIAAIALLVIAEHAQAKNEGERDGGSTEQITTRGALLASSHAEQVRHIYVPGVHHPSNRERLA